jgi:hypothetical protein
VRCERHATTIAGRDGRASSAAGAAPMDFAGARVSTSAR